MTDINEGFPEAEIQIRVNAARLPEFFQLLQQGIVLRREVGCTVRSFLYHQLQLSSEFIENNIQTVFLDGKPVDDLDKVYVKAGCTLALSAAMPGLVGATLRRGGYYKSLRAQISHGSKEDDPPAAAEGLVTLKLFNLVARSLGKTLLQDGVLVKKKNFEDFMGRWFDTPMKGIVAVRDGKRLDWNALRAFCNAVEPALFRLKVLETGTQRNYF